MSAGVIAVVGGSGRLGRVVVAELLGRAERVQVLVREPTRAVLRLGPDVEVVPLDIRRADDVDLALRDASTVLLLAHGFLGGRGAPEAVDHRGTANVARRANRVGAHVVMVSMLGARPDSPMELARAKYAGEQALRASGASFTVVRAGPFLETWQQVLRDTAGRSGRPLVLGHGRRPIPFVPVADVAALVVRAALDPSLREQVLTVSGPPQTMTDLAAAVQRQDGHDRAPRHLPRVALRTAAALTHLAPAAARRASTALVMDTEDLPEPAAPLRRP